MFDISNAVAYDNSMVFGTPERKPIPIPESAWIDVKSDVSSGHWIPREGEMVRTVLQQLIRLSVSPEDIFMLTPFRDCERKLWPIARSFGIKKFGTVHKSQGKEFDIVLFILGGDPSRPGAKSWAAQKPNLVNVAVSRARRRLYIIGDYQSWHDRPNFRVCAEQLPRVKGLKI